MRRRIPFRLVPNKPPLNFEGSPTWAEFIILRLLERAGWRGVWVKNWGGRAFWIDIGQAVELPPTASAKLKEIELRNASNSGVLGHLCLARRRLSIHRIEAARPRPITDDAACMDGERAQKRVVCLGVRDRGVVRLPAVIANRCPVCSNVPATGRRRHVGA